MTDFTQRVIDERERLDMEEEERMNTLETVALERIATALEQIALELVSLRPVARAAEAPRPPYPLATGEKVTTLVPPACPLHAKPWRSGKFGWYCPTRTNDGWCQLKPEVVEQGYQQQLP